MQTCEDIKKEYWKTWDEHDRLNKIFDQQTEQYDRIKWTHMRDISNIKSKLQILGENFNESIRGMNNPPNLNDGYPEYLNKRKETLGY